MKFIKNIKVNQRLMALTGVALLIIAIISSLSIISITNMYKEYREKYEYVTVPLGNIGNARGHYNFMQINILNLCNPANIESRDKYKGLIEGELNSYINYIAEYKQLIDSNPKTSPEEMEKVLALYGILGEMKTIVNQVVALAMNEEYDKAISLYNSDFRALADRAVVPNLLPLVQLKLEESEMSADNAMNYGKNLTASLIGIFIISIIILITMAIIVIKSITRPIEQLVAAASDLSMGNLDTAITYRSKDEIGVLADVVRSVSATLNSILDDISKMSMQQADGDLKAYINADAYEGAYSRVASGINSMMQCLLSEMTTFIKCLKKIGDGDFNIVMQPLNGDKIVFNNVLDELKNNFQGLNDNISLLAEAAADGELDKTIDINQYQGDWRRMVEGLNNLTMSIGSPIKEATEVLIEVSNGNLKTILEGCYKGAFNDLKLSINRTIHQLNRYIQDITSVLVELSNDNYNLEVTSDYHGDFAAIKTGLNRIIDRINNVMGDVSSSAEQVADGAKVISQSSIELASGALEQTRAVQSLTDTVGSILSQSKNSATAANDTAVIANKVYEDAINGNKDMDKMLTAMEEINTSANSISDIIKIVEDIAFQTNLLALNAAVEAARAGQHGKGFSVVAEEVRNLAIRSQKAVNETTELIDHTVIKASYGMSIANETAKSLKNIVNGVNQISDQIVTIAKSAKEQDLNILHVNEGLSQISDVTISNNVISQNSAASSEELSSQSETFKNMVSAFKLRA